LAAACGAESSRVVVARDASLEVWADAAIRAAASPAPSDECRAEIARSLSVRRLADDLASLYTSEI
jgi:hypothetical protein